MKQTGGFKAVEILKKEIRRLKGVFSLTDASRSTGLSIDEARTALDEILSGYSCRLQVTENGDLIYNFGPSLQRKGKKKLREILYSAGLILWKAFTVIFKIWVTAMLVIYCLIFVMILIALMVAMIAGSSKDKERKSSSSSDLFGGIFRLIYSIFRWNTYTGTVISRRDRYGYDYRKYESSKPFFNEKSENKKNFIAAVYDFVFGPKRVEVNPLANEMEAAEYLRRNKGLLTLSELIALAGWTFDQSELKFADYISRFKGETYISENKVMYGRFDEVIRSKSEYAGGKIEYYWNEYEPPYELTGNSVLQNVGVIIINSFNLFMSFKVLSDMDFRHMINELVFRYAADTFVINIALGIIPFVFSMLFFVVPLLRFFYVKIMENKRKYANERRKLMKVIFDNAGNKISLTDIISIFNKSAEAGYKPVSVAIDKMADRLQLELRGEKDINEEGKIFYSFERINDELSEIKNLREKIKIDTGLGNVVAGT